MSEATSPILNSHGISEAEVKDYLDDLRDSGVTNMFGAGRYLEANFNFTRNEARAELTRWMQSFGR